MLQKLSSPQADPIVKAWVGQGESWARSLFCEAQDLCKLSAARDPELPALVDQVVDELTRIYTNQSFATPEEREFFDKRSSVPGVFMRFHDEVIVGEEQIARELEFEKESGIFEDFVNGYEGSYKGRRNASDLAARVGPKATGPFGWQDPLYDVTRGLKKVDEGSRDAYKYLAMTPEQRVAQGVYFQTDVPTLGRLFKPKPRTLREAVLLGTQEGIREVNEHEPGIFEGAKLWLARKNAKGLARKAQWDRVNGNYLGLLGTVEDGLPTIKSRVQDLAGSAGDLARRAPLPVKLLAGAGALGAGAIGVSELLKRRRGRKEGLATTSSPPGAGNNVYIQIPGGTS